MKIVVRKSTRNRIVKKLGRGLSVFGACVIVFAFLVYLHLRFINRMTLTGDDLSTILTCIVLGVIVVYNGEVFYSNADKRDRCFAPIFESNAVMTFGEVAKLLNMHERRLMWELRLHKVSEKDLRKINSNSLLIFKKDRKKN